MAIISRVLLAFLILYWGGFALVTPITVWDAHTYNVARIPLALEGGLFGNQYWNSDRQVANPWGFDALHLVFFWLGGGASLPSYLCFVGTLAIVWVIVNTHRGPNAATLCALGMFSMPTFVYQATSTKNDWAVVFGIACWFYFLWLHHRSTNKWLPWGMAFSLAFAAGAKSFGVPLMILAALTTLCVLRRHVRDAFKFSAALLLATVLWGSVETYINNVFVYGHLLGPESFVKWHTNNDGLRGAVANAIRYAFGSVNFGVDQRDSGFLVGQCRQVLEVVGLQDLGCGADFLDLAFLKIGWEAGSDYGLMGFISLVGSVCIFLRSAWRTTEWRLAASGFLCFGIVCASVAWMPWNLRFLMLPFLLFLIASILSLEAYFVRRPGLKAVLNLVILHGIIVYPIGSFNKSPRAFWAAIVRRENATFQERPSMQKVFQGVRSAVADENMTVLFLHAGEDSWILPFFQIEKLRVMPRPHLTQTPILTGLLQEGESAGLLVLNLSFSPEEGRGWSIYGKFAEADSALYLWRNPSNRGGAPRMSRFETSDGMP